jgi:hypothetical protein
MAFTVVVPLNVNGTRRRHRLVAGFSFPDYFLEGAFPTITGTTVDFPL